MTRAPVAAMPRIAVAGLGRLGIELCRAAQRDGRLVAVASSRGQRAASDAGLDVPASDLDAVLARDDVDTLLHGGDADAAAAAALFERCARAGKDAVTSAALLHPHSELGDAAAGALDRLARSRGARLLGTGLNPGFLLDLLPAICASLAPGWTSVRATRAVEAGPWGRSTLARLGIGRDPRSVTDDAPLSLAPSLRVLGDMLGAPTPVIDERRRAIVAHETVVHGPTTIPAGQAMGFHHTATAALSDERRLEVAWRAVVGLAEHDPGAEGGVVVEIAGASPLRLEMTGAFSDDPYEATAARMVAAAGAMRGLRPGLLTVAEVPFAGPPATP